jgi:phospholipid-binding lipoprotein MlaA
MFEGGRALRIALALLAVAALAACATAPPPTDPVARAEYDQTNDPYEPFNRRVFAFNLAIDDAVVRPIALSYRENVPPPVRTGIRNLIDHYNSPVTFINDLLQGEPVRAAETGTRFFVNTLFGFGGVDDIAARNGLAKHKEDFGQTLAVWGAGEGPYLMVPLLGPSNFRDLGGRVVDSRLNPISYGLDAAGVGWIEFVIALVDGLDTRARLLDQTDELRRTSLDYYASVRSLYRQDREAEITNGGVRRIPLPGESE